MKILVTGGAGYLGSVIVPMLLQGGHKVTVIDNFMYNQGALWNAGEIENLIIVKGDVRDTFSIHPFLRKVDAVFPLACLTGMPICKKFPVPAREIIFEAVEMMLKYLSKDQIIIYPTTNSGYGVGENGIYCTEETPLRPVSLYGELKVAAEKMILERGNAVSLRLATVFGASPRMRLDLLVNDFVFKAVQDGVIKIFEPHFKRNYIHIKDVAGAFILSLNNFQNMKNNIYNVGLSSANLSKMELCREIKKQIPELVTEEIEGKDPDQRNYIVSNEKIERAGWCPKVSLEDGIAELIGVFREPRFRSINPIQFRNV